MITSRADETFIASNITSLEDFLKTPVSLGKSIHCTYPIFTLDSYIRRRLVEMDIQVISFSDGKVLYPPSFS
ncbi:hypothetical protein [Vibrio vulnificus]|uniref:hypothetical protein n=1 Tax=Vibrio vulnificus TaxID=672 RepID=UPI001CDB7121|nr:hypothetical protein [Vibrio vulnificus]MCA3967018.1 hypothetical protein [Vibrio vulnificus]